MTNTYQDQENRKLSGFFRKYQDIIAAIQRQDRDGFFFFDDFQGGGAAQSSTAHTWYGGLPAQNYLTYATASTTVKPSNTAADDEIGVLEIAGNDADNDECYLTFDNTYTEAFGKVSNAAGDRRPIWFEARVRFSDVSLQVSKFIGLNERAAPATGDIANGGASFADKSYLGFRALAADPDGMDAVYRNNGGASERVAKEAAAFTSLNLTASTFKKFGLHFDGTHFWYYVDGVKVNSTGILPSATDFPNGDPLLPKLMVRSEEAVSGQKVGIDWWAFMRLDDLYIR